MSDHRPRCWVSSVNLDQVLLGVESGSTQAAPARETRLRRLGRGDQIAFFSPRAAAGAARPLQRFTALGVVADDEPFLVDLADGSQVWRRRIDYEQVATVPVKPLLPVLGFVDDEERWGVPFRRGLFEVQPGDLAAIAGAMRDAADESAHVIGSASS